LLEMSGKLTNQDLASQNVPTSLLTQNNFRFARDPSRIDAKRGDHCLQADFTGLIPPWKPESFRLAEYLRLTQIRMHSA
jgi:hypothetical protein